MGMYNEPGTYRAVIMTGRLSESKTKKTPQIELELDLICLVSKGEEIDIATPDFPPVVYLSITEGTMGTPAEPGWLATSLQSIGFTGDFDKECQSLVGKEIKAICAEETPLGSTRSHEKWSILFPRTPKGPASEGLAKDTQKRWGSLFNPAAKTAPTPPPANEPAAKKSKPANRKPARQHANSIPDGVKGDDIPF